MAKIEMDMSEYEAMKKVEAVLEQALEREKVLNDEVAELTREKIELLKSNEKVITIVNRVDTTEQIYTYKTANQIYEALKMHFQDGNRRMIGSHHEGIFDSHHHDRMYADMARHDNYATNQLLMYSLIKRFILLKVNL